jgi:dipeptidase
MMVRPAGIVVFLILLCGIPMLSAQEEEREKAEDPEIHLYHVQPEKTTKRYHNRTETEYRIFRNLYMIKTVPDAGSPYYMVDKLGTGELEYRRNMENLDIQVPDWVLFRW